MPGVCPHHNHAKSALRVRGPSAATPWCNTRTGHAPRDSNALAKAFRPRCRRPVAVLVRSRLGRRREEERAARWPTSQTRQVRAARRVLCGPSAASPWCDTRAGRAPRVSNVLTKPFESSSVDRSQCWGGRTSVDGVERSAPRVGPHYNHAKSALRGACSAVRRSLLHGAIRARDTRHGVRTRWPRPAPLVGQRNVGSRHEVSASPQAV